MEASRSSLGTAYLLLVLADASLSVVATLTPSAEGLSNLISTLVILASLVVLVRSLAGRLEPRSIFLGVSIAYLAIGGAGLIDHVRVR